MYSNLFSPLTPLNYGYKINNWFVLYYYTYAVVELKKKKKGDCDLNLPI